MNCLTTSELLAAWEGLLSEPERQQQAAHLAQCARCQDFERTLREIARRAPAMMASTGLAAPASCPTESELLDYVSQQVAEPGRAKVQSHLAGCRQCLWQVAAMVSAEPEELPPVATQWQGAVHQAESLIKDYAEAKSAGWSALIPSWRYALASSAVVGLLAVGWFWYAAPRVSSEAPSPAAQMAPASPPAPHPTEKADLLAQQKQPTPPGPERRPEIQVRKATGTTGPSLGVLWPHEGQQVKREGLEIRWQAMPQAHLYQVTVLNRRGDVVWEGEAEGARVRVPDEVNLQAGERYFVWVLAHVKGQGTAQSPSVAFEIQNPDSP